jgi:hypothetical protein
VAALIEETVHSTALLLSLAALVLGALIVTAIRKVSMAGKPSGFAAWAGRGFGFDGFYLALLNGAYAAASWIAAVYDRFTDWIGRMIISLSVAFGRALREQNIGDLNKNLLWLVSGIVIVIAIVWAKRG